MPVHSVTIQPPPAQWRTALRSHNTSESARRFRQQLGLPTDRSIVFSGHQAMIWHAGILAKYLAASHIAESCHGAAAWVVVDQDPEDFGTLRLPRRHASGRLAAESVELVDAATIAAIRSGVPPCHISRFTIAKPANIDELLNPVHHATPSTLPGHSAILATLAAAPGTNAAEQLSAATQTLLAPLAPGVSHILATRLAHTDAFSALVARMAEDPIRCHHCYNDAAKRFPEAGIAPLATDKAGSPELPLWLIDPRTGLRKRIFAADLAQWPAQMLAPRALLLTALLRLEGCELFIHGAGGGASGAGEGYDRVTEAWISTWLERPLAPAILVTATVTLPIGGAESVTPQQVEAARQKARKTRHDPALVGDAATVARKLQLISQLNATKDKHEKARIYDAMKSLLADAEKSNAPALAALDAQAEDLAARLADLPIASDRTWAFPLHDPTDLRDLSNRIRAITA